ncbi:hypothetical protein ACLGI4_06810 [Streptomyces sp. HMX112]|uniref:hypothetical protein n=1 Tax=Streptomyces sp. HMX112 TaxID=3390850 RepID=UPI003A80108D
MGVFAWFRRKDKESGNAPAGEAAGATLTDAPADAPEPAVEASTAPSGASAAAEAAEAAQAPEPAEQPEAAEGVEIPKQQSAEEAADNEAGEGARK